MIQIFFFTAPVPQGMDGAAIVASMQASLERLTRLNPTLRGARITTAQGVLQLYLRCAGHDQWLISRAARRIAATMLRRSKVDYRTAVLEEVQTEQTARSLSKDDGRPPINRPSRKERLARPGAWDHVDWWGDPVN